VGELGFVARIITSENPTVDARRYLRHWANEAFVADRLRSKHPALGSDRRRMKSRHIAVFIEQGVEFLESAAASAVLTKPLALFYAAESLAKAACIFPC
jgi:2-keto-4-pentenoate hydratase